MLIEILALRLIENRRLDLGAKTHVAFIDLKKAFNEVKWRHIMNILKGTGLDFWERRIIYHLYTGSMGRDG